MKQKILTLYFKNKYGKEVSKKFINKSPQEIKNDIWYNKEFLDCTVLFEQENCDNDYIFEIINIIRDFEKTNKG